VTIALEAAALDAEGIGFDFVRARGELLGLVARFEHRDLNEIPPFDRLSPTTERIAIYFCEEMQRRLPEAVVRSATVWEGPSCRATYFAEEGVDA
jgi:6-pyruvoyltetrahydropterin/6-carboxytetrahydropterin synthase